MQATTRRAILAAGLSLPGFGLAARAFAQEPPPPAAGPASGPAPGQAPAAAPPPDTDANAAAIRGPDAELLVRMLAEAPSHGFRSDAFPVEGLAERLRGSDPAARIALRRMAIAYAGAQHGQRIPLAKFDSNWGMKPQPYAALLDFDFAVAHDRVKPWIASQPPPFARYRALREGLGVYMGLAKSGGWGVTPPGPDLALGARGPRVRALRARIAFDDPGVARARPDAPFDPALQAAVKRFQLRHGIAPTGVVSAATLSALNATPADRAATIRANMERWRWAPRDRAPTRLEVNIAAAELDIYADDRRVGSMLAAPGRPKDETPILASEIGSIVFNPAWHVPKSIAAKELFRKGKGYLRAHGFSYVADNPGAPLIQKPGPHNALGRIKFDFPNAYSVYLHDTPGQGVFGRSARNVSHGCVRLQHPEELAKQLLSADAAWTPERIDQVLAGDQTTRAMLPQPMAVILAYWTAFDDGPQLAFRGDIYGWDQEITALLDA